MPLKILSRFKKPQIVNPEPLPQEKSDESGGDEFGWSVRDTVMLVSTTAASAVPVLGFLTTTIAGFQGGVTLDDSLRDSEEAEPGMGGTIAGVALGIALGISTAVSLGPGLSFGAMTAGLSLLSSAFTAVSMFKAIEGDHSFEIKEERSVAAALEAEKAFEKIEVAKEEVNLTLEDGTEISYGRLKPVFGGPGVWINGENCSSHRAEIGKGGLYFYDRDDYFTHRIRPDGSSRIET